MIADRVVHAATPGARAKGLLGRRPLGRGEALVLEPARQVHTFGLSYPIDVCFCDRAWRVVHVVSEMPLRRVTRWVRRARYAVEMRAGELSGVYPGDQLSLEELNERYAPS